MEKQHILLLGSGGRESALAWKLSQSPLCERLYIAPGNGGTSAFGENVNLDVKNFETIKIFCLEKNIQIVLPGPEDPLVNGIFDFFQNDAQLKNITVVGPSQAGAQLEGSKAFSKKFMARHQIPTASYRQFDKNNFDEGMDYLAQHSLPIVLKADGLAAGKGVIIAQSLKEAQTAFTQMIKDAQFGEASSTVVVESFLDGIELSVFAFTDGKHYCILPEAKDYKRIGEGDTGPNTGGMGAISPVPFADEQFLLKVKSHIIEPTIRGLQEEGIHYQGFLFFGLIKVNDAPWVIEYNCRMGDPETEVVLPRLQNDLVDMILHMRDKKLNEIVIKQSKESAATIMLVSKGYPGDYEKGETIQMAEDRAESLIFHAGTKLENDELRTSGGRVMAITNLGESIGEAVEKSLKTAHDIQFEGKNYRKDIGYEF